jgi:hypothetical protein
MAALIHELRNQLTNAMLTATAMIDGKLATNVGNLRELERALANLDGLLATAGTYDFEPTASGSIVDLREVIHTVADELAVVAGAADVSLVLLRGPDADCCAVRGPAGLLCAALDGAIRALVPQLPPGSSIALTPAAGAAVLLELAVPSPGTTPSLAALAPTIEPPLAARGGRLHAGRTPGQLCVHLPAETLCSPSTQHPCNEVPQ